MTLNFKRSLKVRINGKSYLVEVSDASVSPLTVKVNGQPYRVDIETAVVEKSPAGEPPAPVENAAQPEPTPQAGPLPTAPAGATLTTIRAPLPGHIIDLAVKPGDQVGCGQILCSLEAMKMKNVIRSHRAGVIAQVHVTAGQAVAYNEILMTFK
jgi:biotin carboxyl carrier protein